MEDKETKFAKEKKFVKVQTGTTSWIITNIK